MGGCLPPDQGVPGMAPSIALRDGGMMTELWPCTSPARTQKAAIIVTRSRVTDGEVEDGGWMGEESVVVVVGAAVVGTRSFGSN